MPDSRRLEETIVEIGGIVVAAVLPIWFNPWSDRPFELAKVVLFGCVVAAMSVTVAVIRLTRRRESGSRVIRAPWQWSAENPLALPSLAYGAVFLLATITSMNWKTSLLGSRESPHGTVTILGTVLFFLLLVGGLNARERRERVVKALLAGSVPVSLYGIAQFLGLDPLPWTPDCISPVISTMGWRSFVGAYLAMVIPFTLFRIVSGNGTFRHLIILMLQVTCLWMTTARAAWLALLGSTALFLLLLAMRWKNRLLGGVAILVLFVGIGPYVLMNKAPPPGWRGSLCPVSEGESTAPAIPYAQMRTASVNARWLVWEATLRLIQRRWLIGYGPEQFTAVAGDYPVIVGDDLLLQEHIAAISTVNDPHNLFLDHWMAAGILGLMALLGILAVFYRHLFQALRHCDDRHTQTALAAVLASVTAFLIQAQFNPDVITTTALFWLVMALGIGMMGKNEQEGPSCPTTVVSVASG